MTTTQHHSLITRRSTDEVEARDTATEPLNFHLDLHWTAQVGDTVDVTSADGDIFIGSVVDTDEDLDRMYVELS